MTMLSCFPLYICTTVPWPPGLWLHLDNRDVRQQACKLEHLHHTYPASRWCKSAALSQVSCACRQSGVCIMHELHAQVAAVEQS